MAESDFIPKSAALAEICGLRQQQQFAQAESRLDQILAREPENWATTLSLMRLYAEDLSRPDKALALIQPKDKPSALPRGFIKCARQSIDEWTGMKMNAGHRAAKIIRQMEKTSRFTPREIDFAKSRLKDWQAGRRA